MEIKFAERLKELRKNEKITQAQLANKLGVAQSNVSDWENNIARPEYENLAKLAQIFDVTTDYLLGLSDYI